MDGSTVLPIVEYNNSSWNGNLALSTSANSVWPAEVTDMDFHNALGLATTNGQYILRSTDYGTTWDTINAGIGNFDPIILGPEPILCSLQLK